MNHLPTRATADVAVAPEPRPRPHLVAVPSPTVAPPSSDDGEDGSLVAEYGLLAVVAATMAGVLIMWSRGDALTGFFTALLDHARSLVVG